MEKSLGMTLSKDKTIYTSNRKLRMNHKMMMKKI